MLMVDFLWSIVFAWLLDNVFKGDRIIKRAVYAVIKTILTNIQSRDWMTDQLFLIDWLGD